MQVICVLGPPKARLAKGTAESSALGETVLPQDLRKGPVHQHQGLNLNHLPEEVMGAQQRPVWWCSDHDPDQLHRMGEVQDRSFLWVPKLHQPLTRAAAC